MTQLSEAIPTPASSAGHVWGLLGPADRTQWRWEAPTPRPVKKEGRQPSLPSWLSGWDAVSQDASTEDLRVEAAEQKLLMDSACTIEENIRGFRAAISSESDPDTYIANFNRRLEQSLTLGLVSGSLLDYTLHHVPDDLREVSKNIHIAHARCFAFYDSVWRGISASKVLGPVDFEGETINQLVDLLSCLPSSSEVQRLALRIVSSVSSSQLQYVESGITSLVKAWSQSWLKAPNVGDIQSAIRTAEESVINSETKLSDAQRLVSAVQGWTKGRNDFIMAKEAVYDANTATYQALQFITKADQVVSPLEVSVKLLADTLHNVPHDILTRVASSCSEDVKVVGNRERRQHRALRNCWLSTLAHIPNINTQAFLQTWKDLENEDGIRENEASHLILNHWISRGYVANAAIVRNSFEATTEQAGKEDLASLLSALDKHGENSLAQTGELFLVLEDLGKYKWVYKILSRMKDLGLKIPVSYLGRSIDTMSKYDTRLALKTFHLHKVMLLGEGRMRVDLIPNFIMALINHKGITPKHIWEILKIPVYEDFPRSQRHFQSSPLSQTMIDLLHKMALAFAYSDARPPRVALRNVLQCLYHLRLHRAPIGTDLSKAATHVGISEDISKGKWIRQDRLRYVLHLINEVEGKDVAAKADATVLDWRMYMTEKQARENREGNVLRLGPIG